MAKGIKVKKILKVPAQLEKVLSGSVTSKLRYAIEIPEDYIQQGSQLIGQEGNYFILMGPFTDEAEIEAILQKP